MVVDGYALNGSVRLHYLDSNPNGGARKTPIVFVPGMLGSAEDYLTEMETLASRRGLAMSLRARGKSDAPKSGYSLRSRRGHPGGCENGECTGLLSVCVLGRSCLCHRIW